jgi:TonB family protein
MTTTTVQPQGWPRRRWWLVVAMVMLGQITLIFWLSGIEQKPRTAAAPAHVLLPAESGAALPGLSDPTLFVRPNVHGFSGPAWLQIPPLEYQFPDWTEPPRLLPPDTNSLGRAFTDFVATNNSRPVETMPHSEPTMAPLALPQLSFAPTETTVRIEGPLAARPLLSPLAPPPWPASEMILTNTEVVASVARDGMVFSAVVVSGSGSKPADAAACELVRAVRFEPLPPDPRGPDTLLSPAGDLTRGRIIFHWLTVPPPSTNASPNP